MYYINYFFLYSLIGHIIESIIYLSKTGESGILYGPWTPVYGIGIVVILFIDKFLKKYNFKKIKHYFYIFLLSSILLSLSEFLGGVLIEKLFHKTFWDYSKETFNIGKYASLKMALIWGVSSVIFIRYLKNISDKIVKKIPESITWILIVLMIFDVIVTIYFKK